LIKTTYISAGIAESKEDLVIRSILLGFSVAWFVFAGASSAYSKGSPDRILITSDGAHTITITNRETLKKFDPWSAQFIDWARGAVSAPAHQSQSYDVFFYMKWPGRRSDYDRGDLKLIYTVRYVAGLDGAPGYIYLPGEGEKFHSNNIGTIWREKDDGKWRLASAEWDALTKALLVTKRGSQARFVNATLWSIGLWAAETCRLFGE
jgi:hypothetical protein